MIAARVRFCYYVKNMDENKNLALMIPGAILVAGVIIAGAILYTKSDKVAQAPIPEKQAGSPVAGAPAEAKALLEARVGDATLGNPAAPVTVVEFADFQCPFCGRFFKNTLPLIKEKYVKSGQVQFVFRDFAFLGEESFRAAEAVRCAGDQNKFWDFHDYLYNHQNGENQGAFSDGNLKKFADALNLDRVEFDSCFDSKKYRELVEKESSGGRDLGVTGTPATFVNGKIITGAQPFAEFEKEIQAALAAAK